MEDVSFWTSGSWSGNSLRLVLIDLRHAPFESAERSMVPLESLQDAGPLEPAGSQARLWVLSGRSCHHYSKVKEEFCGLFGVKEVPDSLCLRGHPSPCISFSKVTSFEALVSQRPGPSCFV